MGDLIDTTEMYLRTIYELQEEGTPPLRARIAERLSHSGPTVSQTVARMQRDGLLRIGPDRTIELSDSGRAKAARVMRKHRLAECLLSDVLHLEADLLHEEACRWEHVMSEQVERRVLEVLGHPRVSPFGNPIPALDELDSDLAEVTAPAGLTSLAGAVRGGASSVVVHRIDETAQSGDGTLGALRRAGVRVGATVECRPADGRVLVGRGGHYAEVAADVAEHIAVVPALRSKGEGSDAD